ncbi:transposase (plasmid) [Enterococcus faecium]|nr:transposase [Enterococcus faecium]
MMSKNNTNGRNQFAMLTIDDLVPQDHLVRKIDAALDFEFIYPIVEATYSDLGRPSIDPVILIKLVFIQYLFGIRSMRQTIKEVDTNVAYRWFLGYSFEEKIPLSQLLERIMFADLEKRRCLRIFLPIF